MYGFSLIFLSNRNTDFYSAFSLWKKKGKSYYYRLYLKYNW